MGALQCIPSWGLRSVHRLGPPRGSWVLRGAVCARTLVGGVGLQHSLDPPNRLPELWPLPSMGRMRPRISVTGGIQSHWLALHPCLQRSKLGYYQVHLRTSDKGMSQGEQVAPWPHCCTHSTSLPWVGQGLWQSKGLPPLAASPCCPHTSPLPACQFFPDPSFLWRQL